MGEKLREAREEKKLSIDEVASKLFVSHALIELLEGRENNQMSAPSLLDPGYGRLIAVAYARLLGLNMKEIYLLLPPPAPLKSSTFIKKLSPLQPRPKKRYFMRENHQLTYTLNDVKSFLGKMIKALIVVAVLFYLWNFIRHLGRVIF